MSYWFLASLGFMFGTGVVGITTKLALRHVGWPVLVVATTIFYLSLIAVLAVKGSLRFPQAMGSWVLFVAATGALVAGTFPLLATALERADASKVVPITAAYPMVTVILAALLLSEPLTITRIAGVVAITVGVVLVSR